MVFDVYGTTLMLLLQHGTDTLCHQHLGHNIVQHTYLYDVVYVLLFGYVICTNELNLSDEVPLLYSKGTLVLDCP